MNANMMIYNHQTPSYPHQQQQQQQQQMQLHYHFSSPPPCHPLATIPSCSYQQPLEPPQNRLARRLDDLKDVLGRLRRQEKKYYSDLLMVTAASTTIPPIRPHAKLQQTQQTAAALPWKPILIQWMFSVIDIFQLAPHIVPTALYYLDYVMRSQAKPPEPTLANSMQYQLLGLTCLELAIKVHDTKVFPLDDLVRMGQSGFRPCQIVAMEAQLVQHMNWNLHPPTPHCFVHQYGELLQALIDASSDAAPAAPPVKVCSIVEAALQLLRRGIYQQLTQPPAILAYAAMLAAMEQECSALSETMKQSFCVRMLELTGLSAHSPGLAQAYPVMAGTTTTTPAITTTSTTLPTGNRVASPTTIVSGAGAPYSIASSGGVCYYEQQQCSQPQGILPPATASASPVYVATPHTLQPEGRPQPAILPMVMRPPQNRHHHVPQRHPPPIQAPDHWYMAAKDDGTNDATIDKQAPAPPRTTAAAPTSLVQSEPTAPPGRHDDYMAKPTMIYSAGEELGFEVTLNDLVDNADENPTASSSMASSYRIHHDANAARAFEDADGASDISSRGGVDLKMSLSGSSSSWIGSWWNEGVSPRNVTGTVSPNRQ